MKKLLLLVLLFQLSLLVNAQQWDLYTAGNTIKCMTQQADTLWVATNGELVKINTQNNNSTFYNKTNSPFMGTITCLASRTNQLWIGTDNGLAKLEGNVWTIYTKENTSNGLISNKIRSLAISGNTIWVGTGDESFVLNPEQGGLNSFDGNQWVSYTQNGTQYQMPFPRIESLTIDNAGNVWMAPGFQFEIVDTFLVKFNPATSQWSHYRRSVFNNPQLNNTLPIINNIAAYNSYVWLATQDKLIKITLNNPSTINVFENGKYISDVKVGSTGVVWFTVNDSIGEINNNVISYYREDQNSNPSIKTRILPLSGLDHGNVNTQLVIGTANNGLRKLTKIANGVNWEENYVTTNSNCNLENNRITDIAINNMNGDKWIVGEDVVYRFNDQTNLWEIFGGLTGVRSIAVRNGQIWVGTTTGLMKFNGTSWNDYPSPGGKGFSDILIDNNGAVWGIDPFAPPTNYKGITKFDGTTWTTYDATNSGLTDDMGLTSIDIDTVSNTIWIAYNCFGQENSLYSYHINTNTWQPYSSAINPSLNCLHSVGAGMNGKVWLGACNWGSSNLLTFQNGAVINEANPTISCAVIDMITPDPSNPDYAWVGSEDYALSSTIKGGLLLYNSQEILVEYNKRNSPMLSTPTAIAVEKINSTTNKLWIGTEHGMLAYTYNPANVGINHNKHPKETTRIYPNPAQNTVTVQSTDPIRSITIHGLFGQVLAKISVNSTNHNLDISNFNRGVYLLTIETTASAFSHKLVVD